VAYWRQYPPTHVTLSALARSFGGSTRSTSAPARLDAGAADPDAMKGMEGVAAILGPPTQAFRRPCRMQTPAPDPEEKPHG
jgi:hypothetical protein